jgi:DNA uptake protein ComE-like DNA-binding protein
MIRNFRAYMLIAFCAAIIAASGCANETEQQRRDREEKMRQDAAAATEKAKPALEAAGKEVNKIADRAAEDARAAAQGVKEGWKDNHEALVNLNTASPADIAGLPGMTGHDARAVAAHRPYADKHELVTRHVVSQAEFDQISDLITVK